MRQRDKNRRLPMGVTTNKYYPGKFLAQFWCSKEKIVKALGAYDTIKDAETAYRRFEKMYNEGKVHVERKSTGLPKGIRKVSSGNYSATIEFWYGSREKKLFKCHVGTYSTAEEARRAREEFIDKFK